MRDAVRCLVLALACLVGVGGRTAPAHAPELVSPGGATVRLEPAGASVSIGGRVVTLVASALGRGDAWRELAAAAPDVDSDEARAERAAGVVEWWRSLPAGLEHGLTLAKRPAGDGDLEVTLAVGGALDARGAGETIALVDSRGVVVAHYAGLVVLDATGARIPATMTAEHGGIVLRVADGSARYPLVIDPIVSAHEAALLSPAGRADDWFGYAVSLTTDGSRALIGAPSDETMSSGPESARVFLRTGTAWAHEASLVAPGAAADDYFGRSVAISGDGTRAIVGADRDDAAGLDDGSARIFLRTGTAWAFEATLTAPDAEFADGLGVAVSISSDGARVIVGARYDDTGAGGDAGSARVFARTGTTWALEATLLAPDGAPNDNLGASVAISSDATRAIVGAPLDDVMAGSDSGTARVFVRSGTTWAHEAMLVASDFQANDHFGASVAISSDGSRTLIGVDRDDTPGGADAGSARVFVRTGTAWGSEVTLLPEPGGGEHAGVSVSLSSDGGRALVGAHWDATTAGFTAGSASAFVRTGSTWAREALLVAPDGAMGDELGFAVAIAGDGSRALVGTHLDDTTAGTNAGSARVFTLLASNGSVCSTGAVCVSGHCVDGFCCDTTCGGGATTDCQACSAALTGGADGTCAALSTGVAPTVTCRPAAIGGCDVAEICAAGSTGCPADGFSSATTVCRTSAGGCDVVETCTGTSPVCPTDGFETPGTVCRAAATLCDVPESCTGTGPACPGNAVAMAGTVCRAEAGPCDSAEVCDGTTTVCPGDVLEPPGNVCGTGVGDCSLPATCTGSSAMCPSAGVRPAGTMCRPASGACDVADTCDGTSQICVDGFAPDTTACGSVATAVCDAPDHCSGTSADCVAVFLTGVECRASSGGCDPAEACTGADPECPSDRVEPVGMVCRASTETCDPAEACDGTSGACPPDTTSCTTGDAGAGTDAGPTTDAGPGADGAPSDGGALPPAAAGCTCRVRSGGSRLAGLLPFLALLLRRRRDRAPIAP